MFFNNKVCNPFLEGDAGYLANYGCDFEQTPYLVASVFPTPMYEAILGVILFLILWFLRKRIKYAGVLFGIYLMFSGTERFFIEKIRVNTIMDFMGLTQAEIISSSLFILGCILVGYGLVKKIPVSNLGTTVD